MTGCFPTAALPGDSAPRADGGEMSRSALGRGIATILRPDREDPSRKIRGAGRRPGTPGHGSSPCPGGSSGREKPALPIPWLHRNPLCRKCQNILCFRRSRKHLRNRWCRSARNVRSVPPSRKRRKNRWCRSARNVRSAPLSRKRRKNQWCRSARNARSVPPSRKHRKNQRCRSVRNVRSIPVRPAVLTLARLAASQ